jgi:hypothetical protein
MSPTKTKAKAGIANFLIWFSSVFQVNALKIGAIDEKRIT